VMVAGCWRKRNGQLLVADLPKKIEHLSASGRKITQALGL
jgi:hypothetical protein